jgi:hypothetical protein
MVEKHLTLTLSFSTLPQRVDVDPEFDVFRRLHRQELPPAFSQGFGAAHLLFVLPTVASLAVRQVYADFVRRWQQHWPGSYESQGDTDLPTLPTDRAVWLLGWENRFRFHLSAALAAYPGSLHSDSIHFDTTILTRAEHTIALAARHAMPP